MSGSRRVSVTLPGEVVDMLDTLSQASGVSRSAFLSSLLTASLPPMFQMVLDAADPSPDSQRRFRGGSISYVESQLAELQRQVAELPPVEDDGGSDG